MPLVSVKIYTMFCAEYAQKKIKPFHNGLKLDVKIVAYLLFIFPDTSESQSERSKLAALPQPLKNASLSLKNWDKAITH